MDYNNLDPQPDPDENCDECGNLIITMSFRGTGVCSDRCNKSRAAKSDTVASDPGE